MSGARRRPAAGRGSAAGLVVAGVAVLAVGMVGGERWEYLGAWVHVLQHLLLMAGGPVLIVSGFHRPGRVRGGVSAVLAATGYYAVQPLLLLTPWFGALELHPVLHTATHLVLVALGLAYWQAVLGAPAADAATARRLRVVVLAAVPVGLALAAVLAVGPVVGSVAELRSAAWLVALTAVVPAAFALLRVERRLPRIDPPAPQPAELALTGRRRPADITWAGRRLGCLQLLVVSACSG